MIRIESPGMTVKLDLSYETINKSVIIGPRHDNKLPLPCDEVKLTLLESRDDCKTRPVQ
jgi:hypothetical protein